MLLHRLKARNLLSFGPTGIDLELRPLNVLIGPNGSGKSNFIDTIGLLQAAPTNLAAPVRKGGGILDWIWKGKPGATAELEVVVDNPLREMPLRHSIQFAQSSQRFELVDEEVVNAELYPDGADPYDYYRLRRRLPFVFIRRGGEAGHLNHHDLALDESILSQRKDPDQYPELAHLAQSYAGIQLYREWSFGRDTLPRQPQKTDLRTDRLEQDFSNLAMFLNKLRRHPPAKAALLAALRALYEGLTDFDVNVEGGTAQIYFTEGAFTMPATRLSDGSLRYLGLLALLHDPDPPPLIGIEEPELGLHPDLLPRVADLLVAASERCQLIVTTHSDILVDSLSEQPDSVIVCEKHAGQTSLERLTTESVAPYLEKYRLGQLWMQGQLGGTRW